MSLFIPCKPSNVILSKMSDLALRADLKETTFGLLFKYMGKLFHRRDARCEKEDRRKSLLGGCTYSFRLSLRFLNGDCLVNREFILTGAL